MENLSPSQVLPSKFHILWANLVFLRLKNLCPLCLFLVFRSRSGKLYLCRAVYFVIHIFWRSVSWNSASNYFYFTVSCSVWAWIVGGEFLFPEVVVDQVCKILEVLEVDLVLFEAAHFFLNVAESVMPGNFIVSIHLLIFWEITINWLHQKLSKFPFLHRIL